MPLDHTASAILSCRFSTDHRSIQDGETRDGHLGWHCCGRCLGHALPGTNSWLLVLAKQEDEGDSGGVGSRERRGRLFRASSNIRISANKTGERSPSKARCAYWPTRDWFALSVVDTKHIAQLSEPSINNRTAAITQKHHVEPTLFATDAGTLVLIEQDHERSN